jgi:hypothetical protein
MHSEHYRIRLARGLLRRAGPGLAFGVSGKFFELLIASGVAEDHFMPSPRKYGAEFAAHQTRTENANAHATLSSASSLPTSSAQLPLPSS